MAAPVDADLKYYPGANSTNPGNDTTDIGGAISTGGGALDPTDNDLLIGPMSIPTSGGDLIYYGVAYRKNEATGSMDNARLYNRAGAIVNAGSGTAQVVSTSSSDTGTIKITGKVSGVWTQESLTLTGTTPVAGATSWDISTVYRWEHLSSGTPAVPTGSITCSINGAVCGVIYAHNSGTNQNGVKMASAEVTLAAATAQDATITSTDRLTVPSSGISAFSAATKWTGADTSLSVPGTDIAGSSYIGYCIKITAKESIPAPVSGVLQTAITLLGNPSA